MDFSELTGFLAAGVALMGSPGPATLSLAAVGAAFGARAGRAYMFGLVAGVTVVIAGVAAGVLTAVLAIPYAGEVLFVVAAAYIAYLAYRIATAPPVTVQDAGTRAPGFGPGFVLNLANPKAYAVFATLFSGFAVIPAAPVASAGLKILLCVAIVTSVNAGWLVAGNAIRHLLHDPKISRRINLGFAILLLASVAVALLP